MRKRLIKKYSGINPAGDAFLVRVWYDADYAEYVVDAIAGRNIEQEYFTNDRDDALNTASVIAGRGNLPR